MLDHCAWSLKPEVVGSITSSGQFWLLLGVNEKLLTQHISGPVTKYKLLCVSNQGRAGARAKG